MLAVGEHVLGPVEPIWLRMTTGQAGGFGAGEEACGALSAGVMIMGAAHGRSSLDEDYDPALALAARYRERFWAEMGHTRCGKLAEVIEGWAHEGDQLPRRPVREVANDGQGVRSCAELVELSALIILEVLDEAEDMDSLLEWYHSKIQS